MYLRTYFCFLLSAGCAFSGDVTPDEGVRWGSLMKQSSFFLGVQHGFRLATEPGTREGMRGPFVEGWTEAIRSLHGWSDGDPFYVNYVGHPLQGAVSNYIWIQNDTRYLSARFGSNSHYWKSRLRAAAFSWAYSTQFELGPLSEASLGKIQSTHPQQGLVDHAITPTVGLLWTVGEDFLDDRVIAKLETRLSRPWMRAVVRGGLNPGRSFANAMRWKYPWYRDTRSMQGVRLLPEPASTDEPRRGKFARAPFQFTPVADYRHAITRDQRKECIGASSRVEVALNDRVSALGEVGGCKTFNGPEGESSDLLTYLGGMRLYTLSPSRWNPYVEVLAGGQRVTTDRFDPRRPASSENPPDMVQRDGVLVAAGAGLDMVVSRPLSLQLAHFRVGRVWYAHDPGPGQTSVWFSAGLTFRFGTW